MQIPGQNAEAPLRRQISRRENAMKLCLRTISVNDEKRFSGLADRRTIEGGTGPGGVGRSGSRLIYARKHRVYERRHPLAAPTCERRVIAHRASADSGTARWTPRGPPPRRRARLVRVVSRLFNFRAVHRHFLGPSARPLEGVGRGRARGSGSRHYRHTTPARRVAVGPKHEGSLLALAETPRWLSGSGGDANSPSSSGPRNCRSLGSGDCTRAQPRAFIHAR